MIRVGLVGAFDRYNFGDLLFPVIVREWLSRRDARLAFDYYGLVESNLSGYGGVATEAISKLFDEPPAATIVAGGQVLNATWSNMDLNLSRDSCHSMRRVGYRMLGSEIADRYARSKLGGVTELPWVLPKNALGGGRIGYNAVGGTSFRGWSTSQKAALASALVEADYVSVRDQTTARLLAEIGVNDVVVSPDCAAILSELFPVSSLSEWRHQVEGRQPRWLEGEPYLCFQVGKGFARGHEREIVSELRRIAHETGWGIVLLPIGLAAGHEDHVPLGRILNSLQGKVRVYLPQTAGIFSTISLIAGAQAFIGTSLHGCLTAFSYAVPCTGFGGVRKLVSTMGFILGHEWRSFDSFSRIGSALTKAVSISGSDVLDQRRRLAMAMANENFERLYLATIAS